MSKKTLENMPSSGNNVSVSSITNWKIPEGLPRFGSKEPKEKGETLMDKLKKDFPPAKNSNQP